MSESKGRSRGSDRLTISKFEGKNGGTRIDMSVKELRDAACMVLSRYNNQVDTQPCINSIRILS